MRVIITGAAGQIGTQIVEELCATHEICLMDRLPVPGRKSLITNLSTGHSRMHWRRWLKVARSPRWMESFNGADVVLHLAADQNPTVPERQLLFSNMQTTLNVIKAAARHRVPRVVFASSNWAVKAWERESAPSCYTPDGPKIGSDAPPRPITYYGIYKALGEINGRMVVDQGRLGSFVAVRIGSYEPAPPEDEERRHRWIGTQDIRSLLRHCVEAEFKGFHVVYGVSAQPTAPYDLSHTRRLLCWEPRQMP
jgi:NAD+ dependent glucose-6-phosphate dehydrogenase